MTRTLARSRLVLYRAETFRTLPGSNVKDLEEAISFIEQRGFAFFWPIKEVTLPSLWVSVTGDRPVADNHDDPGHVTWGWKDSLLGKHRWYYAKVLRKKATIISLETLPHFYALSENYGSPEEDYMVLYEQGLLSAESKAIYEAILKEGPLDTVALRKAARLTSRENDSRFNRSLTELQTDFKLMPIGVAEAGAWRYAFIYEITARHHPDVISYAQEIGETTARTHLVRLYFQSVGAARFPDITRLFGWRPAQMENAIQPLYESGILIPDVVLEDGREKIITLSELL
jgi:hypothetical protein